MALVQVESEIAKWLDSRHQTLTSEIGALTTEAVSSGPMQKLPAPPTATSPPEDTATASSG